METDTTMENLLEWEGRGSVYGNNFGGTVGGERRHSNHVGGGGGGGYNGGVRGLIIMAWSGDGVKHSLLHRM